MQEKHTDTGGSAEEIGKALAEEGPRTVPEPDEDDDVALRGGLHD